MQLDFNLSPTVHAGQHVTVGNIQMKGDENVDVTTVDQALALADSCAQICAYERTVEIHGDNNSVNIGGDRYTKLSVDGTGNSVTQNGLRLTDKIIILL